MEPITAATPAAARAVHERSAADDLVDRLNRIRLDRDLTYAELADAIGGVSETLVFRFLRGTQRPTERALVKIRRYVERIERS